MAGVVTHRLDVYGVDLYLATTKRQYATLRRKHAFLDPANSAGMSSFAVWEPKQGPVQPILVVWLDPDALTGDELEQVEIIAHEATHGAAQILAWAGHDIRGSDRDGTDEPHAYLTGWLARWLWQNTRTAF